MAEATGKEIFLPENKIPVCDDVEEYISLLRATPTYQRIIDGKTLSQKVPEGEEPYTRQEIADLFEKQEEFKSLFWDFYKGVVHLAYVPNGHSDEFNQAFIEYKDRVLESLQASRGKDPAMATEKDRLRSAAHDKAAEILVKNGESPNELVGRILVRAFLVDEGSDVVESAQQADMNRVLRQVDNDRKAVAETMRRFRPLIGRKFFKPEEIEQIQQGFLRAHPEAKRKDPRDFTLERNRLLRALIE